MTKTKIQCTLVKSILEWHPEYGQRRVAALLRTYGYKCSRERARWLMKLAQLHMDISTQRELSYRRSR